MVGGITALVPTAKIGHIGLCRNEETHQPEEYYCKLPDIIEERQIVVVDPMLATGGSAIAAINFIKQHGGKNIKFLCIISAPEGQKTEQMVDAICEVNGLKTANIRTGENIIVPVTREI